MTTKPIAAANMAMVAVQPRTFIQTPLVRSPITSLWLQSHDQHHQWRRQKTVDDGASIGLMLRKLISIRSSVATAVITSAGSRVALAAGHGR